MPYDVTSLPEVTALELLDLLAPEPFPCVRLEGERAQQGAALWRALPAGIPARCHLPPFELAFFGTEGLILRATACWGCNNIQIQVGDETKSYSFEGSSEEAQQLLMFCRAAFA